MQTTRCPLYISCEVFFDQTKIVYFRMKLRILQHVNRTPWLYVQQGKFPPINIQNFSFIYMCILVYIHDIVWMLKREQPELLTLPLSLLH